MNRRRIAWMWMLLLAASTGCTSLQHEGDVSRDQWEPETTSTTSTAN